MHERILSKRRRLVRWAQRKGTRSPFIANMNLYGGVYMTPLCWQAPAWYGATTLAERLALRRLVQRTAADVEVHAERACRREQRWRALPIHVWLILGATARAGWHDRG